jgi:hypothetical protein
MIFTILFTHTHFFYQKSKVAENLEMKPNQKEQPAKATSKVAAAIPLPWNGNMDDNDNPYNNTNITSPTRSTRNEEKHNDGDGGEAQKRGKQNSKKSAPLAEETLMSSPQKKPAIDVNKGMEVCELT